MDTIHSCSYYCTKPECIRRQRDYLRDQYVVSDAHLQEERNAISQLLGGFHISNAELIRIREAIRARGEDDD